MSGSAFENSIKRKIYVYAAIEDSDECKRLKKQINTLNMAMETLTTYCTKCYYKYKILCNYCFGVICKDCDLHTSCEKCNTMLCLNCESNSTCHVCIYDN